MPDKKHYVFSARTTEEGLKLLNDIKIRLGIGWDELIIRAVNTAYDVSVPMPPKAEKTPKAESPKPAKKGNKGQAEIAE